MNRSVKFLGKIKLIAKMNVNIKVLRFQEPKLERLIWSLSIFF